ncbi:MAG: hypothetical protein DRQ49_09005 [Gammaproteobacteria bacterium]|nr:MAG: hypothetical protein DRQ49_09005 [Gammaproteobacteria bacterium]RKZ41743.1 MAG: hypothetical protein DRQ41_07885 [Gammaproteobacteria bacterium]RKZ76000.1 MAG: hypothetical protein DRQ57_05450 [Gammaproteobacteria bacterium]
MRLLSLAMTIVSVLCILIKLYTTEVMFNDDPTIMLIIKDKPSLENRRIITWDSSIKEAIVLIYDENGYIGQSVYVAIVSWVWIVLPLFTLFIGGFLIIKGQP